jgi:hypothetical protein
MAERRRRIARSWCVALKWACRVRVGAGPGRAGSDKFLCAGEIDRATGPLLFGRRRSTALCSGWVPAAAPPALKAARDGRRDAAYLPPRSAAAVLLCSRVPSPSLVVSAGQTGDASLVGCPAAEMYCCPIRSNLRPWPSIRSPAAFCARVSWSAALPQSDLLCALVRVTARGPRDPCFLSLLRPGPVAPLPGSAGRDSCGAAARSQLQEGLRGRG